MPNLIIYDAALASPTTLLSTDLNSLATNTLSAVSSAFDNTSNLDTLFFLELVTGTLGGSPTAGQTIDIYAVKSYDGTNYSDAPATGGANDSDRYITSFAYKAATTARRFMAGPFGLEPCLYKFYVDNRLSQNLASSGNTLKIWTISLEVQ